MGIKRTSSEGSAPKAAKLPPKRKVAVRPKAVETAINTPAITTTAPAPREPEMPVGRTSEISPELIALRAYFICEQRRVEGRDGDSLSDWLEAERQLRSEA